MAPCWQVETWGLSPSLFPTHISASKHFLFGWNLFSWFESSRNSSSIDADDGTKWSLASRRADCSTSSAIPRPRLFLWSIKHILLTWETELGHHLQGETPWSLGLSLGRLVVAVMSGKQRGLLSFAVAHSHLTSDIFLTSGSGRPKAATQINPINQAAAGLSFKSIQPVPSSRKEKSLPSPWALGHGGYLGIDELQDHCSSQSKLHFLSSDKTSFFLSTVHKICIHFSREIMYLWQISLFC